MKYVTTTVIALFLALGVTTVAQPGSLDATFGTNGIVTTSFGSQSAFGQSIAVQSDGKIVMAGGLFSGFALVRYLDDGTLDYSFGVGGEVVTAFGSSSDYPWSVAVQMDGKILVAGQTTNSELYTEFALARYNENGSLDNSFGLGGIVTTNFGTNAVGTSLAIQEDGKIIVTGCANSSSPQSIFALARYNMDGILDSEFGIGGQVTTPFGGNDLSYSVAIQSDGKILVAGASWMTSIGFGFALGRYNTDGSLDNSFGVGGKVSTTFGTIESRGWSVAIQADGKIIVVGDVWNGSGRDFGVARYNTDGSIDNSFGMDGKVITSFGPGSSTPHSVLIQADGKILACGDDDSVFVMARYNTDGALDNSFGISGKVTTVMSMGGSGQSATIQPDGKIIIAGSGSSGQFFFSAFVVARYLSGLNLGLVDLSITNNAPLIYPNPIDKQSTLEYTLPIAETISIHLLDMQGRAVQTFIEGQHQAAGEHQQVIDFAEDLPAGSYLIAISSPKGRLTVQVVK